MTKKLMLIFVFTILLLVSCTNEKNIDVENYMDKEIEDNENIRFSIWTAYWDTDDLEHEIKDMGKVDNICYFAAYFNEDKILFVPKETKESLKRIESLGNRKYGSYLTIVNDLLLADNKSSLKDTDLLYTLFATEETMNNHIEDILNIVIKEGFDGIEIDYEAINKDINLWELFIEFIDKLYKSANGKDIPVRVVLEPNVPLDKITLPEGPEYIIMCYNLHGYGTEPGPKANKVFIEDMIKKSEGLKGDIGFALATGGYDFQSNGIVNALTEREAVELSKFYNKIPQRDESGALFFNYMDNEEVSHQVWYANKDTINYWIGIITEAGDYGISIWKIGGNINLLNEN
ncbi:glycosyl hydrolase family 18 protein [Tissierella pigra]|uniref:Glycosyl hydrolase n=1 Tax=Tissierella pigra TaxID=2607614 RepID=A0A6N7XKE2_9FIRM|nr:glycosyl hydrolase family 18 protein [Tissierella pigra]MSU02046.1 glycosyl hydrolase [Tissierella pigra]